MVCWAVVVPEKRFQLHFEARWRQPVGTVAKRSASLNSHIILFFVDSVLCSWVVVLYPNRCVYLVYYIAI